MPWPADTAYTTTDVHVLYGDQDDEAEQPTGQQFAAALQPAPELAVITSRAATSTRPACLDEALVSIRAARQHV